MPSDEAAILALLTAAKLPLDGVRGTLGSFIVAEEASRIVGTAAVEVCGERAVNALLRSVAVDSDLRGHGVGRALVEHAIDRARDQGVIDLYLLTTTAEKYFPTFGFLQTTRDSVPGDVRANVEFQGACPASAIVMVLPLVGA